MENERPGYWRRGSLRFASQQTHSSKVGINEGLVSQFTLLASTKKGSKPDFHGALGGEQAKELYQCVFPVDMVRCFRYILTLIVGCL